MRIEQIANDSGTIFMLVGGITSPDVQQLKAEIAEARNRVALDLEQVRLVDLDAVHFLAEAERRGVELRHLPQYVREWILLEKPRVGELDGDGPLDSGIKQQESNRRSDPWIESREAEARRKGRRELVERNAAARR